MTRPRVMEDVDSRAYLERIAELLGCPVDVFFDRERESTGDVRMLRLWLAIRAPADRDRVLAMLEGIVADQDRHRC